MVACAATGQLVIIIVTGVRVLAEGGGRVVAGCFTCDVSAVSYLLIAAHKHGNIMRDIWKCLLLVHICDMPAVYECYYICCPTCGCRIVLLSFVVRSIVSECNIFVHGRVRKHTRSHTNHAMQLIYIVREPTHTHTIVRVYVGI